MRSPIATSQSHGNLSRPRNDWIKQRNKLTLKGHSRQKTRRERKKPPCLNQRPLGQTCHIHHIAKVTESVSLRLSGPAQQGSAGCGPWKGKQVCHSLGNGGWAFAAPVGLDLGWLLVPMVNAGRQCCSDAAASSPSDWTLGRWWRVRNARARVDGMAMEMGRVSVRCEGGGEGPIMALLYAQILDN